MHELLFQAENQGVPEMIQKYQQECQIMSSHRHPNVTQFLGLCFLPGTQLPLLVMERLETSLDDLLENAPNLPLSLKRSILENVASGLLYLHERNPPVIHRDLTSRNVLLTTSLAAKITDMGNSRIVRPVQVVRTLSALPGTLVYMPPEAQDDAHRYGPSLDIFSFGHAPCPLHHYTGTKAMLTKNPSFLLFSVQIFPGNLLPSTFLDVGNLQARNELQRREQYVEILEAHIGRYHPALVELVKECLNNDPDQRPTTDDLLARLQRMREEVEMVCGGGVVRLDLSKIKLFKEVKIKDRRIEELTQQQVAMHVVYIDNRSKLSSHRKHMKLRWRIKPENWRT